MTKSEAISDENDNGFAKFPAKEELRVMRKDDNRKRIFEKNFIFSCVFHFFYLPSLRESLVGNVRVLLVLHGRGKLCKMICCNFIMILYYVNICIFIRSCKGAILYNAKGE